MTQEELDRFLALRAHLFAAIKAALEEDGHCKSYEGAFGIVFPNYFEEREMTGWQITLDCYIIGPNRHYHWNGDTFAEALDRADRDVRSWIIAAEKERNEP